MLNQTSIHFFIDPIQNRKKSKKILFLFFVNKSLKNHNSKNICHRTICMEPNERENFKIYFTHQLYLRAQLVDRDAQLFFK